MENKKLKNFGIITEKEYVGKTQAEATKMAEDAGFIVRIVEKDGSASILSMDARNDRINFRLRNNIVIGVYGG